MKNVDVIVFDFDGVLVNTMPDILSSVSAALNSVGVSDCTEEFIENSIGGGARKGMTKCLGKENAYLIEDALKNFKSHYDKHCADSSYLYPGIKEILEHYYGTKKIAVATAKFRNPTITIMKKLGIYEYFNYIVSFDDVARPKPDGQCLEKIIDYFDCQKERTILIGDTTTDILTGKNADIDVCAVTYGFGDIKDILEAKPAVIIDDILELKKIIL